MRFSDLTVDFPGTTNRLYQRLEELRASSAEIVDLVSGNVDDHGIVFPSERLTAILTEAWDMAQENKALRGSHASRRLRDAR